VADVDKNYIVHRRTYEPGRGLRGLQSPVGQTILFGAIAKFFWQKTAVKNEKKIFFLFINRQ